MFFWVCKPQGVARESNSRSPCCIGAANLHDEKSSSLLKLFMARRCEAQKLLGRSAKHKVHFWALGHYFHTRILFSEDALSIIMTFGFLVYGPDSVFWRRPVQNPNFAKCWIFDSWSLFDLTFQQRIQGLDEAIHIKHKSYCIHSALLDYSSINGPTMIGARVPTLPIAVTKVPSAFQQRIQG